MRRFELEQATAPAGAALVCVAGAELVVSPLVGVLGVLAGETLELAADAWLVAWAGALELCEPQPTARIVPATTIPAVSEFRAICTLSAIGAIPPVKSPESQVRITTYTTAVRPHWLR
jgi:hypothetical protein